MSTWACFFAALAIETRLQLLDRGAGQDQRLVVQYVVHISPDRREEIDLTEVGGRLGEADAQGVAVDHQRVLAEVEAGQPLARRLGLGLAEVEILEHDESAVAGLGGERHLEAERAHLLVERRIEVADARAVGLAAADEDRRAAIAVAGGAATFLATELLAGTGDVAALAHRAGGDAAALARGAGGTAALLELPGHDPVEDVGARLDIEDLVVEIDVLAGLAVE